MAHKRKENGFTIVELLIVIVVIGILALLVITTFSGIQQRARNTNRQTDIKAIHGQVEAYYANYGHYPTLANINDEVWRGDNMKGLDPDALTDPQDDTGTVALVATPTVGRYSYAVQPTTCDNDPAVGGLCTGYTLTANYEGGDTFVRESLN